jgi:predicted DNA-binding protein
MERGNGEAQVVILAPQELIDRADALRIVLAAKDVPMNRSRVMLAALKGDGLEVMESLYRDRLLRLEALAHRAGKTYAAYVRAYAIANQRKSYAPTLEDLEAAEKAARG